jgi:hypothetical protein
MKKYFYTMAGEDPNLIHQHHIDTQRRTLNYGLLIHIPIFVWFFIGFYMSSYLFESSTIFSLIIGIVFSLIIYAIDRSIINSAKSKPLTIFRISMGIIFAAVGAFLVDVMVFEKDINKYLANYDAEAVREVYQADISKLSTEVETKRIAWLAAESEALKEADGSGGSKPANDQSMQLLMQQRSEITNEFVQKRQDVTKAFDQEITRCGLFCSEAPIIAKRDKALNDLALQEKQALALINAKIETLNAGSTTQSPRGRGKVWEAKKQHADQLKSDYIKAKDGLEGMQLNLDSEVESAQLNAGSDNGLINKVKALHAVAFEETDSILFYIAVFLAFLALELILVCNKVFSPATIDDRRAEHEARMQFKEMEVMEDTLKQYHQMISEEEGRSYGV